jgi:hypothetical protein
MKICLVITLKIMSPNNQGQLNSVMAITKNIKPNKTAHPKLVGCFESVTYGRT